MPLVVASQGSYDSAAGRKERWRIVHRMVTALPAKRRKTNHRMQDQKVLGTQLACPMRRSKPTIVEHAIHAATSMMQKQLDFLAKANNVPSSTKVGATNNEAKDMSSVGI